MSTNSIAARRKSCNLNFRVAQKMVHRFLTQERIKTALDEGRVINHHGSSVGSEVRIRAYTREELARKLNVSLEEFGKLKSPNFYRGIASKISLPLVRLYCATRFIDGDYKDK